ncbi:MAG: isocitrate lyase/phosphoenolpyruvate mutase family protein [Alphaproteobacteria bacterium]
MATPAAIKQPTYIERIQTIQERIDSGEINPAGLSAEAIVRNKIMSELEGEPVTGLAIARRNAAIMHSDMASFQQDQSKYTQSLGAATGWVLQQFMKAAKAANQLDKAYWYLSGWQIAAMKSEMSPKPDVSGHEKSSVWRTIEEGYRFLQEADAVELLDIFKDMDKARAAQDTEAVNRLINKVDTYKSHIRPIIADIDAGFGDPAATYELAKKMIQAGACCIQLENQVSDQKQCGHQGGKVTSTPEEYLAKMKAVNQAFSDLGVDGILVARTDSVDATLTKDLSPADSPYARRYNDFIAEDPITNERPLKDNDILIARNGVPTRLQRLPNGLFEFKAGTGHERAAQDAAFAIIEGGAQSVWVETSAANLKEITNLRHRIETVIAERVTAIKEARDAAIAEGRKSDATALSAQITRIEKRPFNFTYNNSPSFAWVLKTRQMLLKEWAAEGKDISAYPTDASIASSKWDNTPLGEATKEYIRNFQSKSANDAKVFHHLITLAEFHLAGANAQLLMQKFLGPDAMWAYVSGVQNKELQENLSLVRHQHEVGSDVTDSRKQNAWGEVANVAATAANTQNDITAAAKAAAKSLGSVPTATPPQRPADIAAPKKPTSAHDVQ